ncbi:MAG: CBS domain-containing protein [Sulfolobaceae archaeon]
MSKGLKTVNADQTLKEALDKMVKENIRRLAVSVAGQVIGVISARTIVKEALSNPNWAQKKVSEVTRPGIFADPDTPNKIGAKLMVKYGVGSLLIRGGGIVTERDIAKAAPRTTIPAISIGTTNVVTLSDSSTMSDAASLMVSTGISHAPIVSDTDVVGMVSLRDVIKSLNDGNLSANVKDYMSKGVVSLDVDATMADVANLITTKNVGAVLIMEDLSTKASNLRGIVTEWDLVRTYSTLTRAHVLLKVDPSKIRSIASALVVTPRISGVSIVYGPYDIVVDMDVESPEALGKVVVDSIGSMAGVKETLTLIEVEEL